MGPKVILNINQRSYNSILLFFTKQMTFLIILAYNLPPKSPKTKNSMFWGLGGKNINYNNNDIMIMIILKNNK